MSSLPFDSGVFGYVGRAALTDGTTIKNAYIDTVHIKRIPDPTELQDPVTLNYLNYFMTQNMLGTKSLSISGSSWVDIPETIVPWYGNYTLHVNATNESYPNAQWQAARASSQDYGVITCGVFSPPNADCVLQIRWLPQTLLQIRKTTSDFDGVYTIKTS